MSKKHVLDGKYAYERSVEFDTQISYHIAYIWIGLFHEFVCAILTVTEINHNSRIYKTYCRLEYLPTTRKIADPRFLLLFTMHCLHMPVIETIIEKKETYLSNSDFIRNRTPQSSHFSLNTCWERCRASIIASAKHFRHCIHF